MEDLERYLKDFVDPTIAEFETNPASLRHAFIACVVTFHAVDYLAYPRKKPRSVRNKWRRKSKAFAIVDDVAHAFKHVTTGRNPNRHNLKAKEVVSRRGGFDPAAFSSAFDVGAVTLETDPAVNVLKTVKEAAYFLRSPDA
jgi:hypothetical protein